jgi:hypothetical protein
MVVRLVIVVLLLALAPATAIADFTWAPAVALPEDLPAFDAKVVSTATGETVAAFVVQKEGGSRLLATWLDATGALHGPVDLGPANGAGIEMAADAAGTTYLTWSGAGGVVRRPAAGAFLPAQDLVTGEGEAQHLAVNARGDIGLAWQRFIPGTQERPNGAWAWEAAVVPAGSVAPVPAVTLVADGPGGGLADVAMAGNGDLVAVRTGSGKPGFAETAILPFGGTPVVQRLDESPGDLVCPSVAAGPNGEAVAAWHEVTYLCGYNGPVHAALRAPGQPFGAAAPAAGGGQGTFPVVAVDGAGRALLGFNAANGIAGTGTVLTAPSGGGWATASTMPGMIQHLSGDHLAFEGGVGAAGSGPLSARIAADGTLADLQDVTADCRGGQTSFDTDPQGRAGVILHTSLNGYALARQVTGTPAAAKCTPPPPVTVTEPPAQTPSWSPPPAETASSKLKIAVRRGPRRTVLVGLLLEPAAGKISATAKLTIPGRRARVARRTGWTPGALSIRLGKADWKALLRRGGTVRVTAAQRNKKLWNRWTVSRRVAKA